ncbi:MAG: YbaN family protein [Hyphomonadaceae bacterium]
MSTPPPPEPPKGHPLTRPMFFVAGLFFVGVGIVGYILPVMPGTIFLIIAAACFARSSSRLETWLLNHPQLGPSVKAWRANGAIPRRIKVVAITSMVVSFGLLLFAHISPEWMTAAGVVLLACALFVATRPEGPKAAS